MTDIIHLLPDHIANQIAAGEVVQRPASVVKELLENAVDASATSIKLIIKDAGKSLIQVVDNGKGMSETDVRMAFERHATSKIKQSEDLFNIHTKGFRGEALASIAAVSQVETTTMFFDNEIGTRLVIEGSVIISQENIVTPKGSAIAVKNLFYNVPARRNFLKSNPIELKHIIDEFHRIILAHPEIAFSFYNNSTPIFELTQTNLKQRIVHVFGANTNEKLIPINEDTNFMSLSGFISKPEYAKKTRGEQFFFVNNRFIKSPFFNHAILKAYEGLIRERCYPSYYIYFKVDPKSIDINIHPTKTEIKFEEEQAIYTIIKSSIKHALGQFDISPSLDFNYQKNLDIPYAFNKKTPSTPKINIDRTFNPFKENKTYQKKNEIQHTEQFYKDLAPKQQIIEIESNQNQELFNGEDFKVEIETIQVQKKYIITTIKSGIIIVNQRRAHQRIIYEHLIKNIHKPNHLSKPLLIPIELEYSPKELNLLELSRDYFKSLGLTFNIKGDAVLELLSIPVYIDENQLPMILENCLSELEIGQESKSLNFAEYQAKSLCKYLSISKGQKLERDYQETLVNDLFACDNSLVSPFNKPIYKTISLTEIERKFI